jgi:hypothetical protein
MTNECKDRDLLAIEPSIFTGGGFESQQMSSGTEGVIGGTIFSDESGNFIAAKVQAGMVLCVYTTVPAEARSYEILSVNSPTSLTVSVLRPERDGEAVPPPGEVALKHYINTFQPQIAEAQRTLNEKLRQLGEAAGIAPASYVDSSQLRQALAFVVLAGIFTARASNARRDDANWIKAEFYRRQHAAALARLRIARDIDGDGFAEHTRTLGNVSLRRV